ncbi:ACP S-malonyltransferase [Granulicatella sp. zg-ZJ]|uniref:ACP S-malonyltransferase n=1 Tax=Granulicatella sp. zg-ZJ TaxID=2678504 RepID=UPI0013D2D69E|nr:ACP S-malonyltransferase [Granulicatella sp. zg-ZJ]NEW62190.1 ACP S-malonyltransferase [Granulicatella sp. zg-ZJ]
MTLAFVFSGQGAQYEKMGSTLYEKYPQVKEIYDRAKDLLGYDILSLTQEQLNQTYYTQPAIFTMSVAITHLFSSHGIQPNIVAGLSLGEYSALVCANTLSFEKALLLLQKRAQFMEQVSQQTVSKMLAVMNMPREELEALCKQVCDTSTYYVAPANYNMPGQIVISGEEKGILLMEQLLTERGMKYLPLSVSGAFHTKLMHEASVLLRPFLEKEVFHEPIIPVICNTYAKDIRSFSIPDVLTKQIENPVYFQDSIQEMIRLGATTFVEIGPKKILSKFIKKIDKNVHVMNVEDVLSFEHAIHALEE